VNASNQIIDGTTTCLVWVDGEKVFQPPLEFLRVSSVTVAQLEKIVGQPLSEQSRTPAELEGCELYALNSLNGIRAVTSWINGPTLEVNPHRLETWRAAYQNLFTALPESA
jgi:branched-subunit amino acid aminotransferase/4-amino-4-deoxychorismate lyase